MNLKKSFYCASIILFTLYVSGGIPGSIASTAHGNEAEAIIQFEQNNPVDDHSYHSYLVEKYLNDHPDLLKWNMEVDNRIFQVFVDRAHEVIIVRGEAEDYKLKEKVEDHIEARAPGNFRIIYDIEVIDTSEKSSGKKHRQG